MLITLRGQKIKNFQTKKNFTRIGGSVENNYIPT